MDVRCERCKAQYVFDDEQVTLTGLAVQCTNCGHLFKVKKKELVVTVPVKPGELDATPLPASAAAPRPGSGVAHAPPPPAPVEPREWRVRSPGGAVRTCRELTTVQKWIVEGKVARDAEISADGESWKRLGDIAELGSFFEVVAQAERGRALPAEPPRAPARVPPPPPTGYPPPALPLPPPGTIVRPAHSVVREPTPPVPEAARRGGRVASGVVILAVAAVAGAAFVPGVREAVVGKVGEIWGRASGTPNPNPSPNPTGSLEAGHPERSEAASAAERSRGTPTPTESEAAAAPASATESATATAAESATAAATVSATATATESAPATAPAPDAAPPSPPASPEAGAAPAAPLAAAAPEKPARPRGPKAILAEAERLRARGAYARALELYGRVASDDPDNVAALTGRGLCYLDLSRYAPAAASFEAALKRDPAQADALLGLAEAYRALGRDADAVRCYERYLAQHPDGDEAPVARNAIAELRR